MPDGIYKIDVDVNGAKSGSDRFETTQDKGQFTPEEIAQDREGIPKGIAKPKVTPEKESIFTKKNLTIAGAGAAVIGNAALAQYEQDLAFRGDTNRVEQINEYKRAAQMGLTIAGGFAAGGPLGGLGAGLYVVYGLAQENRKLINAQKDDKYQSKYYQERLIKDVTKRSR